MTRQSGEPYPLLHLVVTIAVTTLLLACVAPHVQGALLEHRQARAARDLAIIHTALTGYHQAKGHYPDRLNDLVTAGYLSRAISLRSPLSGFWYFYAVDDNRGSRAQSFVLGAPEPDAGPPSHLFHQLPLPQGYPPDQVAPAWLHHGAGEELYLYNQGDQEPLTNPPTTLSAYRCCDLLTP